MIVEPPTIMQEPAGTPPTAAQVARLAARRRFNRLTVYAPMVLVALLWLGLIAGMIWLAVAGAWFNVNTRQEDFRALFSGVADFVIMGAVIPWLLLCAVATYVPIGLLIYRRRQKAEEPPRPEKLPLFWRIENVVNTVYARLNEDVLPRVARPVIGAHALAAYLRTFFATIKRTIQQTLRRS